MRDWRILLEKLVRVSLFTFESRGQARVLFLVLGVLCVALSFSMSFISVSATTVNVDDNTVSVGRKVTIFGETSSVPGSTVSAYLDLVVGGTILNTATVNADDYEMDVIVPAAGAGKGQPWMTFPSYNKALITGFHYENNFRLLVLDNVLELWENVFQTSLGMHSENTIPLPR